ncbi:MAG: hypothetical protein ABII89_02255 [Candidatus Omnitrophota bacterium]
MDKTWFKMQDLIKKEYEKSVWIPLLSSQMLKKHGEIGYEGYEEEFFGAVAIAFPENKKKEALECNWSDVRLGHDNGPYADENGYMEAGNFEHYKNGVEGKYLVLQQYFEHGKEKPEWHLSQDLILALKLWRKGDVWVSPEENYIEVVRLKRNGGDKPVYFEIRAEHLKDYLAARKAGILLSRFHYRRTIVSNCNKIGWEENYQQTKTQEQFRWEGRCHAIHEGSCSPYGSQMAVFQAGRLDVDYNEDVPTYDFPPDEKVWSESKTLNFRGRKLYVVSSELWKTEWIKSALKSPRVRGDKIESKIPFIIDNEGNTLCADDLEKSVRYLWFKSTVVQVILAYPKAILEWYTKDTGQLGLLGRAVHFGVNSEGLITVYAKDIALLPESDKKIWVAHNVSPEGGASKELLQSQMEARPASTHASEILLIDSMKYLDQVIEKKWDKKLFLFHPQADEIQRKIHRFQAVDLPGVCILAKEMTKFIIERFDYNLLKSLTSNLDKKTGSLKRLERILCDYELNGMKLVAPLVGIYELRKQDAHLSSDDFREALKLIEVDEDKNSLMIGENIILKVAEGLYIIAELLSRKQEKGVRT